MTPADARRGRVKICGVTRVEDARLAVDLGADLLGLNFWPGSPRCVEVERAAEIAAAVGGRASVVGVFVNAAPGEVARVEARVDLDRLQFHGDEPPHEVERWGERAIRAIRFDPERPRFDLAAYPRVWGFLFEARRAGYGGSGVAWDYGAIAELACERPVLVAGGIRPETARGALERSRAWGVDVCSGVESRPGVKDPARLEALFRELERR